MKSLALIVSETYGMQGMGQVIIADRDCTSLIHIGDTVEIETHSGLTFTTIVRDTMISDPPNAEGKRVKMWSIRVDNPKSLSNDDFLHAKVFALKD